MGGDDSNYDFLFGSDPAPNSRFLNLLSFHEDSVQIYSSSISTCHVVFFEIYVHTQTN